MRTRANTVCAALLLLSGCELTLHEAPAPSIRVYEGRFIDSNVDGLLYESRALATSVGYTDNGGRFLYTSPDNVVSFHVGPVPLGDARAGNGQVSPATLIDHASRDRSPPTCSDVLCDALYDESRVYNRARLLIALDEDQDPSNGIVLPRGLTTHLMQPATGLGTSPGSFPVRFAQDFFTADVQPVLDAAADYYGRPVSLPSVDSTVEHLRRSFTQPCGPTDLWAGDRGDCTVQLAWSRPGECAVVGEAAWDLMHIYLGTPAEPPSITDTAAIVREARGGRDFVNVWPDGSPLPRGEYLAFVTSARRNGVESPPSNTVRFTVDCIEPAARPDAGPPTGTDAGPGPGPGTPCASWMVNGRAEPDQTADLCTFEYVEGSAARLEIRLFGDRACDRDNSRRVILQLQEVDAPQPIPMRRYDLQYNTLGNRGILVHTYDYFSAQGSDDRNRGSVTFSSVSSDELVGQFAFNHEQASSDTCSPPTDSCVFGNFRAVRRSCDCASSGGVTCTP